VLRCVDRFLVPYPEDGSCDEGPSYWTRAGASLFDNLELLYTATDGRFDVYDDETVRNMGRFIYRMHIAGDAYVCVGDCDAEIQIPRELVYRYGQRIGDADMQALATSDLSGNLIEPSHRGPWSMMRPLYALFNLAALRAAGTASPPYVRDVWLPHGDMQVMVARDREGTAEGLYVAAWGGHNARSHNHNDVGSYIVYMDGAPVLIDVGRPVYTRQTFSRDRYKIWTMQSAYHNLPTVNGCMQGVGRQFAARDVQCRHDEASAALVMDLARAYPKEAGIASWTRTVRLERGAAVTVEDVFKLAGDSADIVQSLMTPCEVVKQEPGKLAFEGVGGVAATVAYEPSNLAVEIETIKLDDAWLCKAWGASLRRVVLKATKPATNGTWTIRVLGRR